MIDKYPNWRPWVITHKEVMEGFDRSIRDHWTSVIAVIRWLLDWFNKRIDNQLKWNKTLVDKIL